MLEHQKAWWGLEGNRKKMNIEVKKFLYFKFPAQFIEFYVVFLRKTQKLPSLFTYALFFYQIESYFSNGAGNSKN